jgi:hypothetical protein
MVKTKNAVFLVVIVAILVFVITAPIFCIKGNVDSRVAVQQEAVKNGVGEFYSAPDGSGVCFRWKTPKNAGIAVSISASIIPEKLKEFMQLNAAKDDMAVAYGKYKQALKEYEEAGRRHQKLLDEVLNVERDPNIHKPGD